MSFPCLKYAPVTQSAAVLAGQQSPVHPVIGIDNVYIAQSTTANTESICAPWSPPLKDHLIYIPFIHILNIVMILRLGFCGGIIF